MFYRGGRWPMEAQPNPMAKVELADEEAEAREAYETEMPVEDANGNLNLIEPPVEPPYVSVPDARFLDDEDLDKEVVFVKNPVPLIRSSRALKAMEKLRKYDFHKAPLARQERRQTVANLKCGQNCPIHGVGIRTFNAGPWHYCPFRHDYGELFTADPMPKKRRNLKQALALSPFRQYQYEKRLQNCTHCANYLFRHSKDPETHYTDYLNNVTWFGHRLDETAAQIRRRLSPRNFVSTLMEYDETYNPSWMKDAGLDDKPQEFNFDYFSTEVTQEFMTLLDPLNRYLLYENPNLPRQLRSGPPTSLRRARSAAATRELRKASKTAPTSKSNPTSPRGTSRDRLTGNAGLMGYNYSASKAFANIKSRYMMPMNRMEKLKLKASVELPRSALAVLPEGAYPSGVPVSPLIQSRDPPVFKQLKPKEAKLVMGKVGTRLVDIARPRTTQPVLSPRLEFLSQPKPKPVRPPKPKIRNPRASIAIAASQRSKTSTKSTTPRFVVKPTMSGLLTRNARKKLAKPKKAKSGKSNVEKKPAKKILTAFGFDFEVPVLRKSSPFQISRPRVPKSKSVSPVKVKKEKKPLSKEAQREKYRKSIMKMLENAARRSKKRKEQDRLENLERGLAAMAIQAAAAVEAAEEAAAHKTL